MAQFHEKAFASECVGEGGRRFGFMASLWYWFMTYLHEVAFASEEGGGGCQFGQLQRGPLGLHKGFRRNNNTPLPRWLCGRVLAVLVRFEPAKLIVASGYER
jgi:hypothetical protein